ncbi:MAG: arsenate reductase ArsC [Actinomycetota bacterium]
MNKKKVLILCTGNSCRSQMAEGFFKKLVPHWEIESAGIHPTRVNPTAAEVMAEEGIDISDQHSKSVDEFLGQEFDYIITVCDNARESCPAFPGKGKYIHWSIEDPDRFTGNRRMEKFRAARDEIKSRIEDFLEEVKE